MEMERQRSCLVHPGAAWEVFDGTMLHAFLFISHPSLGGSAAVASPEHRRRKKGSIWLRNQNILWQ